MGGVHKKNEKIPMLDPVNAENYGGQPKQDEIGREYSAYTPLVKISQIPVERILPAPLE
jgi:hypothetical protein